MFPKLKLLGLRESDWVEPPEREMAAGELDALLTTEILPVAFPAAVGVNTALKLAICPTAKVTGNERPLMLNPVEAVA